MLEIQVGKYTSLICKPIPPYGLPFMWISGDAAIQELETIIIENLLVIDLISGLNYFHSAN